MINNKSSKEEIFDLLGLDINEFTFLTDMTRTGVLAKSKLYLIKIVCDDYGLCKVLCMRYVNGRTCYNNYNGPAIITFNTEGNLHTIIYYIDDKRHRNDGPAYIEFNTEGNLYAIIYYIDDKKHRNNGPAYIFYYNGIIEKEEYWIAGKRHNRIGPAIRIFDNGVWYNRFYINNINISLSTFCKGFNI